ncbi:hypothetical protein C0991_001258 [Blastosporella zonata]|nr:hypothetical protein C0991_001258 [Blastosporella zonata]
MFSTRVKSDLTILLSTSQGVNGFTNALVKPFTLDEIQAVVTDARKKGLKVRVVGSCHSSPPEVILGIDDPTKVVLLSLTNYRGVTVDLHGIASVKAGTNLGKDPSNPDSTLENSFTKIVDDKGWALPITGGIIHQALGGFLQTGSAGGSLTYGIHDTIIGFTVVTGTGEIKKFNRNDSDSSGFFAGGVSLGLFGVVTDVQIQLEKTYLVEGTQIGYDSATGGNHPPPLDILGKDSKLPYLKNYLEDANNVYCRILWWPQHKLNRLQIWRAVRVSKTPPPSIKPYQELTVEMQLLAKGVLAFTWQANFGGNNTYDEVIAYLLANFVPFDTVDFCDKWYKILPSDNAIRDLILPTCFTEVWVDPQDATKAVNIFNTLHTSDGGSIGNFPTELYSAKKSDFWLSPSNSGNKIRLDILFHQYNTESGNVQPPFKYYSPETFFAKYWKALDTANISYNTHWGKYRPDSQCTTAYLKAHYPKYDEWMKLRAQLDPDQIFVSPYWAKHLQIPPKSQT